MSLFSVRHKRVLVTGGTRGIGLMIARHLAASGAHVLLSSRSEEACRSAAASVTAATPGASSVYARDMPGTYVGAVPGDVSTRRGCEDLAARASEIYGGRLDVLVNNAGAAWGEPLDRTSGRANWGFDKVLDLNVKGVFYLSVACAPLLEAAAGEGGPSRIVNVGSIAGITPQDAPTHAYDASKAAVHHLTRKMAKDYAAKNITVNAIAPGYVKTRMSEGLGKYADLETIRKNVPLGRLGNDEDMAGAVQYLTSRAGSWCTGVILNVDGGALGALQMPLSSL